MADRATGWFTGASLWAQRFYLAVTGAVMALGQAPTNLLPVSLAAFALGLMLLHRADSPRRAFGGGFWFGLGYFAVALRWIVAPFLVDVARHGWMAPFAIVLMAAGAALFWAVARWIAYRLAPRSLLLIGLMIAGAEVTRSLVLTGFPWALIGHVWIGSGVDQLAAWIGPHGLTVLAVVFAWGLVLLAHRRWWGGVFPVAVFAVGLWMAPGPAPDVDGPVVRLVQPNAPQDEKWDPAKRHVFFDRLLDFTGRAPVPDLVIWPETAIPVLFDYAWSELELAAEAAQGAPLITGINRSAERTYRNSMIVVGRGGDVSAIYDKAHIVPFGEYIPGGEWLARFGITGLAASQGAGFTAGGLQPLVDIPGIGPARALICYEGIFAEEIATGARPRLMVMITNDAWFGKGAGPAQHVAQARLRAIEQGLPMARSANTGTSAMIDAWGRVTGAIALNTAGYLDVPLPPARPATVYSTAGDLPVMGVLMLLVASVTLRRRRYS